MSGITIERAKDIEDATVRTAYRVHRDGAFLGLVWSYRAFSYRGVDGWNSGIRIRDFHPIRWRYGLNLDEGHLTYWRQYAIERLIILVDEKARPA